MGQWIFDLMHIHFECLNRFWVVSHFGISLIVVIDLISLHREIKLRHIYKVQLFSCLKHHIFHQMFIEVLVVKCNVYYLLTDQTV